MLDNAEEPFDEIALAVESEVAIALDFRFDFGGMTTRIARAVRLSTK